MIKIRSLKESELESWLDHCLYVFNKGNYSEHYRQYFKDHWQNDPWRNPEGILVAADGERIVSTVRVFFRKICLSGEALTMGGIGEVSTKPEYRGKGLTSALMRHAICLMEEKKIKVSLLFTGIHDFYRKFGWEIGKSFWKIAHIPAKADFPYEVRPFNINTDLSAVKEIYSQYSGSFNGPLVRDEDYYWRHWFAGWLKQNWFGENNEKECLVVEEKNRILSYITFEVKEERLAVMEFGALPSYKKLFDPLVSYLLTKKGNLRAVKYPHVIESDLPVKEVKEDNSKMYRLITPFSVGGKEIKDTEDFLQVLTDTGDSSEGNKLLFWGVDSF